MDRVKTKFITKGKLPLVIEPAHARLSFLDLLRIIDENRAFLHKKLLNFGGLLFRGFPVQCVDDFNTIIEALQLGRIVNYTGGDSPRNKVKGKIYTSTEAPPSLKIPLHNELSFIKNHPNHIYFYCETPSQTGGATIIADARKVYQSIDPQVRSRFVDKGLKYISNYYRTSFLIDFVNKIQRGHKTWMEVFETDHKEEVEKKCQEQEFDYQWSRNDWLQVSQVRPAITTHPKTGEKVWFNQAHLYDFNPKLIGFMNYLGTKLVYCRKNTKLHEIYHADGSAIMRKDLYHIMQTLDQNTIDYPWQKGDVLVLDNILAMHGRASFTGKRRVLTALTR